MQQNSPRQQWKTLLQRILNENFHNEIEFSQRWLIEYSFEEIERFQRVLTAKRSILPIRKTNRMWMTFERSILHWKIFDFEKGKVQLVPTRSHWHYLMKISAFEQRDSLKFNGQKRVTIVSPNRSMLKSLTQSTISLTSPLRWRTSYPPVQQPQFSLQSRLSLRRSVSYGFGLGTKTQSTMIIGSATAEPTIISPNSNYRLPSNKIDLDMNEEHFIRRAGSLKRKSVSD